jgi:hypothetical protein
VRGRTLLCAILERIALPTGKERIQKPRGGHDDLCNAAAGACVLAHASAPPLNITSDLLNQIRQYGLARQRRQAAASFFRTW